jgi:hypothetical protein
VAPTGLSVTCPSSRQAKIQVSWNAVTNANYDVYQSTTSASTGYSLVSSGVTTTSWASGTLANGKYWFEVSAVFGSNWQGVNSSASGSSTIQTANPTCAQP